MCGEGQLSGVPEALAFVLGVEQDRGRTPPARGPAGTAVPWTSRPGTQGSRGAAPEQRPGANGRMAGPAHGQTKRGISYGARRKDGAHNPRRPGSHAFPQAVVTDRRSFELAYVQCNMPVKAARPPGTLFPYTREQEQLRVQPGPRAAALHETSNSGRRNSARPGPQKGLSRTRQAPRQEIPGRKTRRSRRPAPADNNSGPGAPPGAPQGVRNPSGGVRKPPRGTRTPHFGSQSDLTGPGRAENRPQGCPEAPQGAISPSGDPGHRSGGHGAAFRPPPRRPGAPRTPNPIVSNQGGATFGAAGTMGPRHTAGPGTMTRRHHRLPAGALSFTKGEPPATEYSGAGGKPEAWTYEQARGRAPLPSPGRRQKR